jgi:hypothetical protein
MHARRATTATALTAVSLIAAATVLAGCGANNNGSKSSDSGGGSGAHAPSAAEPGKARSEDGGNASGGGSGTHTSARVVPITRSVVYRGEITVRVKNVAAAVARAEGFAAGVDGLVFAEETSTDPGRKQASQATMSIKVPPTEFRPVLNQLGGLGKQLSRSQTAEDVTSQAVDIESRLHSQRSSVARLQALLARATTVGAIVQVEGELSQREADLEALEAQQKRLGELVDLATINVSFVAPDVKVAAVKTDDNLGFMSGLRGGLNALLVVVVVALTAAGALLPFLITLAVVGVPTLLILRSRRHATPAVAPAGSDS